MRLAKQWVLLPAFLFIAACACGQNIRYNFDPGTDFTAYKTYQWAYIPGGNAPDQLVDQAIKRAIDEQLARKGFSETEEDADLFVAYVAVVHAGKSVDFSNVDGPRWWDTGSLQAATSNTPVGTIAVILYDPAREQLIWRGDASKTLGLKKNPAKNYKILRKAMIKLFKNYPPKPDK